LRRHRRKQPKPPRRSRGPECQHGLRPTPKKRPRAEAKLFCRENISAKPSTLTLTHLPSISKYTRHSLKTQTRRADRPPPMQDGFRMQRQLLNRRFFSCANRRASRGSVVQSRYGLMAGAKQWGPGAQHWQMECGVSFFQNRRLDPRARICAVGANTQEDAKDDVNASLFSIRAAVNFLYSRQCPTSLRRSFYYPRVAGAPGEETLPSRRGC